MKETYYKVIDECVYAISEGKATFQDSMRSITKQLVDSGVRRIVYANDGKKQYTQRIDTAVRRNLLDSIREVSIETQVEFGKRFKADGIEVTVHENPAPDHMNVQGHQFRNEEFEKFQNDEDCKDVNGVEFPAESVETGRDRRSIGEYNCYHTVFSIIVGVSKPLYTDEELQEIKDRANEKIEIDGKEYTRYETTQLQRSIETEIRKAKDSQTMHQIEGDREAMLDDQQRIKQLTRKYREISQKAGIREQLKQRTTVSGYKPIKPKKEEIVNDATKIVTKTPQTSIKERSPFIEWRDKFRKEYGSFDILEGRVKYNENLRDFVELEPSLIKVDKELLDRNLSQLNALETKYKLAKEKEYSLVLSYNGRLSRRIAQTGKNGHRIELGSAYLDKEDHIKILAKGQESGWHSKVKKETLDIYTITHEYGHRVEEYIMDKMRGENFISDVRADQKIYNTIVNRIKDKVGIYNEFEIRDKYLSRYGKSKKNFEWFAETFAKMELGEKDEFVKEFEKWIKENL